MRSKSQYIGDCIVLLNRFTKTKKTMLRAYFLVLKKETVTEIIDKETVAKITNNKVESVARKAYSLVMSKYIYNSIFPLLMTDQKRECLDLLNSFVCESLIDRWLLNKEGVIECHPITQMLAELLLLLCEADVIKNISTSGYDIPFNGKFKVYLLSLDGVDWLNVEKCVSIVNGIITALFEYASSSSMREKIRYFERSFVHQKKIVHKALGKYIKNQNFNISQHTIDLGSFDNNEQGFIKHASIVKEVNAHLIQTLKNLFNTQFKEDLMKSEMVGEAEEAIDFKKIEYTWSITPEVVNGNTCLTLNIILYSPIPELEDENHEVNKNENQQDAKKDIFKLFHDSLKEKVIKQVNSLSNKRDIPVSVKNSSYYGVPKSELTKILIGSTEKKITVEGKSPIRFFGNGCLL